MPKFGKTIGNVDPWTQPSDGGYFKGRDNTLERRAYHRAQRRVDEQEIEDQLDLVIPPVDECD